MERFLLSGSVVVPESLDQANSLCSVGEGYLLWKVETAQPDDSLALDLPREILVGRNRSLSVRDIDRRPPDSLHCRSPDRGPDDDWNPQLSQE